MTARERMIAVYRGERPDRLPVGIYPKYMPLGTTERMARTSTLGLIHFVPAVSLLAPPWHIQDGYVSEVKNANLRVTRERAGGRWVETRTFDTPVGAVSQRTKKDPTYGSDWIEKFYVASVRDYEILNYIVENTQFRSRAPVVDSRLNDLGEDGVLRDFGRSPFMLQISEDIPPGRFHHVVPILCGYMERSAC